MFLLIRILVWVLIFENLTPINVFRSAILNSTNNFAYCFKHKNTNTVVIGNGINTLKYPNSHRNYSFPKSFEGAGITSLNVDRPYLSNLNKQIRLLNRSIAQKNLSDCYRDLKYVYELFSNAISALYSEPVELDLETKFNEIKHNLTNKYKLTIKSNDFNPILLIKYYPNHNDKPDLSFEYLTQEPRNGTVTHKIFRRDVLEQVPIVPRKQLGIAFKEFSRTLGNFLSKFYLEELPFDELFRDAILLGLRGTVELFEGLSLLELTASDKRGYKGVGRGLRAMLNSNYDDLAIIEYFANFDSVRNRFYAKLIGHYFKLKDPDSILIILKHMIKSNDRKVTSVHLTQYLVSLAHEFQKQLDSLAGDSEQVRNEKRRLYLELKGKIKNIMDMYRHNHLHTFNITHELAQIIENHFSDIAPGLFKSAFVTSDTVNSGICESCKRRISFRDISEADRFELFAKLIKTIYNSSPNELIGLYEFYKFLLKAKDSGNPYTCVIDGQNVGYSRNILRVLSWSKIYYSYSFMRSLGENALIVIPEGSVKYISAYLQRKDPLQLKLLNQLKESKGIYMTKRDSYDDNFFLLAGISSFSKKEIEFFNEYMGKMSSSGLYKGDLETRGSIVQNGSGSDDAKKAINDRNVIILTNDKLSNLNIDDVNQEALERWKDYSLINFKVMNISNREMLIMGQRLKYTFSIVSDGDTVHIPTGYDRVFTNISESVKCELEMRNAMNSTQFSVNLCEERETPIKKWIESNYEYLYNINDHSAFADGNEGGITGNGGSNRLVSVTANNGSGGTDYNLEGLNAVDTKNFTRFVDTLHHKSPEIAKLMFSPDEKSMWLCVDLSAVDRTVSDI
ncbi:conserved hypothetical protein [Theileria orientalis strain Shintoku]|uniref:Uncharacterized protein n=1 Tax=Theileria orientalis strain Shintoku TaxID=869250 RepID=J4C7U0_THEOR|nr:conserved hypothetical protein [Theileria orientalis strain Shintoku]BAM39623.1 conserved hypothetical protein [Theileria orientalis strain Shintoku]|eukprot:XP_009689924.1 conserved hypothetical protein [Theileria orientalis strain Shintoku]